jgi:O-acetyl-ADP-ribose deacetylase (regulator of RNase III)
MTIHKPFGRSSTPGTLRLSLCDTSPGMAEAWLACFHDLPEVEILQGDILQLRCDALLSPANSFADMDGGLDKAIDDFFGNQAQRRAKQRIAEEHLGELPVGAALVVPLDDRRFPYLICAPTMRAPGPVPTSVNAYLALRAALVAVCRWNSTAAPPIRSLAVPGLCTGVGAMPHSRAAQQMRAAYDNVLGEGWRSVAYSALAPFVMPGWSWQKRPRGKEGQGPKK